MNGKTLWSSFPRCADINDTHAIEGASFNDMYAEGTTDICSDTETCTLWIYENPNSFVAEVGKQKNQIVKNYNLTDLL